jgi:hypothetical protein
MILTERDKRFLLRGMSLARGVLKNTSCTHHELVRNYQDMIADGWEFEFTAEETEEFKATLDAVNAAIAAKYPDARSRRLT